MKHPKDWATWIKGSAIGGVVATLLLASQTKAALENLEPWALATRAYVRTYVEMVRVSAVTSRDMQLAEAEAATQAKFEQITVSIIQLRVESLRAALSQMRTSRIQLMDLLDNNPGNVQLRADIVELDAAIRSTDAMYQRAECELIQRFEPTRACP